jgi:putative N6-adenine-specific DNA methylase
VIEAARRLRKIPPGWERRFAFLKWPTFDPALWTEVRAEAEGKIGPPVAAPLLGTDRDGGAIRASLSNAERAGVGEMVQFAEADMRELPPDANAVLVTNPPYGVRVGDGRDLLPLYAAFGRLGARSRSATFLTPEHAFSKATGLACRTAWRTTNGGIPIECMTNSSS